jgi:hypothetical protein
MLALTIATILYAVVTASVVSLLGWLVIWFAGRRSKG